MMHRTESGAISAGHQARGVASALIGASLWGFSGTCFQYLMANHGVTSACATWVRMLVAGVLFVAVLLFGPGRERFLAMLRDRSALGSLAVFGVFGLFASQITYVNSMAATNAGTVTVIQSTCSVLVMLWMCLRQRRAPRRLEAAVLGSVRGSMLSAVEPVSASVLSALWLGTVFTGADWIGCALMVIMVILMARGSQEPEA